MRVISSFSGIGTSALVLKQLGFKPTRYHSFELDKYANKVEEHHHPETMQHGDVNTYKTAVNEDIDLLLGGSPCNSFSFAGKGKGFDDPRGQLFYTFMEMLDHYKPKYFFFENVFMREEHEAVINDAFGFEPIRINSSDYSSCSHRKRCYWTNIPFKGVQGDGSQTFEDIREYFCSNKQMFYTEKSLKWLTKVSVRKLSSTGKPRILKQVRGKLGAITASHAKKYGNQRFFYVLDHHLSGDIFKANDNSIEGLEYDADSDILRLNNKPFTDVIGTCNGGFNMRYLTPLECERALGYPDGYTSMISNVQRYKTIGNGWNVDTVRDLLSGMEF